MSLRCILNLIKKNNGIIESLYDPLKKLAQDGLKSLRV
jgi:hypothetical protein